ncbi:ADP-ribosylation factor-like protein 2 [Spathaspora sp. JA1]|nr:ADP-ribosylation factor-like protein 2 [Spathaspora sp. JA1]
MGLLTIIKKQKQKDKEIRVLTLGLDNSGKTTIVKQMMGQDIEQISPTMGFQINTLNYKGYTLNMWDVGGQSTLRAFWGNYFDKTDVVIWVIDGLSLERLNESFKELREKVMQQDRLVGAYLVLAINKVDLVPEKNWEHLKREVTEYLDMEKQDVSGNSNYNVCLVSGKKGSGIDEVLNWIISRKY